MSLKLKIVAGLSVAALLTGCGSIDSAAYMIGGMSTHSLSLTLA